MNVEIPAGTSNIHEFNHVNMDDSNIKTYLTHDNYKRTYKVEMLSNSCVRISENSNFYTSFGPHFVHVFDITFIKAFIGCSPLNYQTNFSGGHGNSFDGNSILVLTSQNENKYEYMFIGHELFMFNTNSEIEEYVSPVGNNDVPYPYAVDSVGKVYLMLEKVKCGHPALKEWLQSDAMNDPYTWYYNVCKITRYEPNSDNLSNLNMIALNFEGITEFWLGREKYNLTYSPDSDKEYDRLVRTFARRIVVEKNVNGQSTKITLKKPDYIALMQRIGLVLMAEPMICI